nr:MAG: hypothetical protein E4H34_06485 [Hyphomicrobiales bacterium]
MSRMTNSSDLTPGELASLSGVAGGQMSRNIPKAHRERLVALRLISDQMGILIPTPEGRIVSGKLG